MSWKSCAFLAMFLCLPVVSLAFAEKHFEGTASLSGVVRNGSGATVAVHLEPANLSPVRYYDGYEAVAKEDGSFTFTEIPPGKYRLTVEANSFLPPIPSAPPGAQITLAIGDDRERRQTGGFTAVFPADLASGMLTLHPREARKGVEVTLIHRLSICGHVTHDTAATDAWGRQTGPQHIVPSDTSITFYHFNSEFGVFDDETKFDTNRDGSFRITDLAPGTYYVNSFGTWYPGTSDFTHAKPVVVGSEANAACEVDLQQVSHSSCVTGTVSGTVRYGSSSEKSSYTVSLLKRNPNGISANIFDYGVPVVVDSQPSGPEDNSFKARACVGDYDVVLNERQHAGVNLWGKAPTQKIVFDTQRVTIAPNETVQIQLTPHAMASIEGEVLLDQVTKEDFCPQCQAIYVSILREGSGEFQTVTLSSGNHFNFHDVTPGEYQIFVTAKRLDKVFLQSMKVDGVEGTGNRFSLPEARFVSMSLTLSGNLAQAAGHASPDVRQAPRWQTEGMRPGASVAGRIEGDGGVESGSKAVYTVRLLPIGYNSNADTSLSKPSSAGSPGTLTTQTAADGSYHFDDVPPGIYRLRAHGKDLIRFDYGGKAAELRGEPLLIARGARIRNLTLRAPGHGASSSICGHLTDTNGNSRVMRIFYRSPADIATNQQSKEVSTDSAGYFRIDGLMAGDYSLQTPDTGRIVSLSSDGQLYEAKAVRLEDGKSAGCGANAPLELHFPANGGSTHTLSGMVSGDLPARLGDRFLVELEDSAHAGLYGSQYKGKLDSDHTFRLENIPSGRYKLNIYGVYGPEPKPQNYGVVLRSAKFGPYAEPLRHLVATQVISVGDQNISGLVLTQLTLPSVMGVVHIPQAPAGWKDFKPSSLSLKLVPHRKNGFLVAPLADKGENLGEFTIGAADAGEYEVHIEAADPRRTADNDLYVASAKLDGREVNPRFFTLPKDGAARLDVELGSEMATVHVQVLPDTSFAMPVLPLNERCNMSIENYSVVLFADPIVSPEIESEPDQLPHFFTAWSLGSYCNGVSNGVNQYWDGRIPRVPPGKYYAIAARGNILSFGLSAPEYLTGNLRGFLSALATIAKPIVVQPEAKLELELVDKTIEANRIAAQVGMADEGENLRQTNGQPCCSR
jgi:hypothetical protein